MTWPLLLTPFLPLLTLVPGGNWALPLVAPLTLWLAFRDQVKLGDYYRAWVLGIVWAFLLSLGVIVLVLWLPDAARAGILHGESYRLEMFRWIATGEAPENHPAVFIPQHLLHLSLFLVLTWASGGYLGLALGAFLVAYMSYFVGSFAYGSAHPFLGSVAAWVPWSVLRVCAFVLLGTLFSRPLLVRRFWPFGRREHRLMALAASGILADILIKALFAPSYGLFLRQMARSAMP
jgi:hypothetical protein